MRSFQFWSTVARPSQAILAACAAMVIVMITSGGFSITIPIIKTGVIMASGIIGASLFHYGAAYKMYARKVHGYVHIEHPIVFIAAGTMCCALSCTIAYYSFSTIVSLIILTDALIIMLYAAFLSKHWITKNLSMALACTSPILLGWFAGNNRPDWILLYSVVVFFCYLAREIIKDIIDIDADRGYRTTLPLWLESSRHALFAAYASLIAAIVFLAMLHDVFASSQIAYLFYWITLIVLISIPHTQARVGTKKIPGIISLSSVSMLFSCIGLLF